MKLIQKAQSQLKQFLKECGIENYRGKKILEIGFKNGLFLDQCQKAGLKSTGLEINKDYYNIVKSELPHLNLLCYDGGKFPLPDKYFDFVVSFQVLEHVSSLEYIFNESIRTLRPGGIMYHVCPNYQSFYDGHFKVIWLPFLNKNLGRLYLKLLRRYRPAYENLNIVKPKPIKKSLKNHENQIELITLGRNEFLNRFSEEQIEKIDQEFIKKTLKILIKLPILKSAILKAIAIANWYYPITVIVKKTGSN